MLVGQGRPFYSVYPMREVAMKINWKALAATDGYKSLKAAYMRYKKSRNTFRSKQELYTHFRWVIGRAIHYSHFQNRRVEDVLNGWETKRTYCWINFYQECNQPRLDKKFSKHPHTLRGTIRSIKRCRWGGKARQKARVCSEIIRFQKKHSSKLKPRWSTERKIRHHRYRSP